MDIPLRSWALLQSDTEQLVRIQGPTLTIGRFPDNDLVLKTPSSSNFHAVINRDDDGIWYIKDLNSSNGTLLNSSRLIPGRSYPLHLSDRLKFTKSFESAPIFTIVTAPDESPAPADLVHVPTQTAAGSDSDAHSVDFADNHTGQWVGSEEEQDQPGVPPPGIEHRTGPEQVSSEDCRSPVVAAADLRIDPDRATTEVAFKSSSGHDGHDEDANSGSFARSVTRKRRREQQRPNLCKVDDYRCVICGELPLAMSADESDLDLVQVLSCRHHFHRGCINLWLETRRTQPTCPVCRTRVDRVEPLLLIHQHASLLLQERQYEIDEQAGDSSANDVQESIDSFLEIMRRTAGKRSDSGSLDAGNSALLNTAGMTMLARLLRLTVTPQLMLQTISVIFEDVFVQEPDLAQLYDSGAIPAAILHVLGQLGQLWVQAALSYDTPIDRQPFQHLLLDVPLPASLRDLISASLRPWSDPDLQTCLRGCTAAIKEPEPIALKRFDILVAQNLQSEAAQYAASQGLYAESSLTWARLRRMDQLTEPGRISSLSWSLRSQIVDILQEGAGPSDHLVFRFARAALEAEPGPVPPSETAHAVAFLVAFLRSSPRPELKRSLSSCESLLAISLSNLDLMYGLLEQMSSINPTAASFLACHIASMLVPQLHTEHRLNLTSLCTTTDIHPDHLSLDRLLQLIITIVSSHGDLQRQQALVEILGQVQLRPSLTLNLTKSLMKVGIRGHPLAWQLLRSSDLSRFTASEMTTISNIVQQLESGGIADHASAPEFFLALFKRRPSRANFNRLQDDTVRSQAIDWLQALPPSEHSLGSVSILIDNADEQQIATIINDCILHESFPFGRDSSLYCHLLVNKNVQNWLMTVPSASGTKIVTIVGQLMATGVLFGEASAGSGLPKLIDDAPEALSARIYECACRSALEQYHDGNIASRSKRNLIRSWVQRLRSLCLVSDGKSRWTGFQNTSMRTLKSTDPLYRELRSAGLYNAVV